MKKTILSLLVLLSLFFIAFKAKDKDKTTDSGFRIKTIDKSVAKITDSLYAGKYEVSNGLYLQFEFDLRKENKTDFVAIGT